ncbi:MAG TPA: NAD(P)-binding domain-containing protein, partial [Myxococcota bacterium]|nr:NAD(P)-binding domain-containing protein [Myxococcota bacterium]
MAGVGLRVGLLGAGAMGEALAGGLLAAGTPTADVVAAEPDAARRDAVAQRLGIRVVDDGAEVVRASDLVVLAVKPGVVGAALDGLGAL